MGLKEVLTVVSGLTGEQDPVTLEEVLRKQSYEITDAIVAEAGQISSQNGFDIRYGLESAVRELRSDQREISTAKEISDLLPQVEELLKNWDSEEAPGRGLKDHENPIHQLQEALGMPSHDGEWGKNTVTALIEYEKEGIQNEVKRF